MGFQKKKIDSSFRFIDDLIAINDVNEFENNCHNIYSPKLI